MVILDESEACRVTHGSKKCICQDGYEGNPCIGECLSKSASCASSKIGRQESANDSLISVIPDCERIFHAFHISKLYNCNDIPNCL